MFQNDISRSYYRTSFTGYYKGGLGTQIQYVNYWPIKKVAEAWELGHSSGMRRGRIKI